MTTSISDQESVIKESLFAFVHAHIPSADVALIDDIVLSYVVAILEDVSSDPLFDVDGFCEMMSAYFPAFGALNHATVCAWMFELEAKMRRANEAQQQQQQTSSDVGVIELNLPAILPRQAKPSSKMAADGAQQDGGGPEVRRVHTLSERSDAGSDFGEEVDALQDAFPHVCALEVKHCVAIACGDLERATHILLHREELGESVSAANASLLLASPKALIDDAELKSRIIARYSYIDQDALAREHRPVAPKVEPKKLVRYRDNKIVSLKGERYTEVKKGDDVEDVSLKRNKKHAAVELQQGGGGGGGGGQTTAQHQHCP